MQWRKIIEHSDNTVEINAPLFSIAITMSNYET